MSSPSPPERDIEHEEYIQRLHVPSQNQFEHIAKVQEEQELNAALRIQREYREHRNRRESKGHKLSPHQQKLSETQKLVDTVKQVQYQHLTSPESRDSRELRRSSIQVESSTGSHSNGVDNWQRAAAITMHALRDDPYDEYDDGASYTSDLRRERKEEREERSKTAKMMSLRYFLEMVDVKHRYGSNLRAYHLEWQKSKTNENFFYWLDYGEGKDIDLAAVSRKRLDTERVRYLTREERMHYLVEIDEEGRLCWAKNGERIDTTESFKDSMEDNQAVPYSSVPKEEHEDEPDTPDTELSSQDSETKDAGQRYSNHGLKKKAPQKLITVSPAVILNRLLRKTVKKNTWIFVADTSFRLYVGIKQSGAFQHSSFLHGSRLSAAGLIQIEDGLLTALSPLSGHYRPPASNFRDFVRDLKDRKVDMSHVSISKSYAVLVGLEAYASGRRKVKKTKNAIGKLGRKTNKDREVIAGDGRKMTEEDIALKEEFDGGLTDHQPFKEVVKDVALAAPSLPIPRLNIHDKLGMGGDSPHTESPQEMEMPDRTMKKKLDVSPGVKDGVNGKESV